MSAQYEDEDPPMTTKERAQEIKTQYTSRGTSLTSRRQFEQLFNNDFFIPELHYHECSEGFTGADVEKLLDLACEVELDTCGGFDGDHLYQCAPVHAINALLLLVASDRSLVDSIAQRMARRSAGTYGGENADFTLKCTGPCLIALMHECGPPSVPYLVMAMRNLLFDVNLPEVSWLAASYVADAMRDIIYDCYTDIPLAISLTDQFCAPLFEFGRHPTASYNPVNKTIASHLLSELVEVAILITDEKEVLELCRSNKCYGDGWAHSWLDILRKFSLEPHPQDELLRERGNRMDWVIQTWNKNHPDKQFPFPRGVVTDGPFPGQPGYELPKRLFKYKYCTESQCAYSNPTVTRTNVKVCERCKHVYYCSIECHRKDWNGCNVRQAEYNRIKLESYPSKFWIRPLKRLTYRRSGLYYHRPHCQLIEAYKQWVKIDKRERNAVAAEDDDNNDEQEV